jgi:hypothetical protein
VRGTDGCAVPQLQEQLHPTEIYILPYGSSWHCQPEPLLPVVWYVVVFQLLPAQNMQNGTKPGLVLHRDMEAVVVKDDVYHLTCPVEPSTT